MVTFKKNSQLRELFNIRVQSKEIYLRFVWYRIVWNFHVSEILTLLNEFLFNIFERTKRKRMVPKSVLI